MGCGKSSVGRRLSELLCCPYMDLDAVIEERTGRSIPDIFASDGEDAFRQMELETLHNILEEVGKQNAPSAPSHSGAAGPSPYAGVRECQFRTSASQPTSKQIILSLGGGTVMTAECAELVREKTLCIYLRTGVETLVDRLSSETEGRPLLNPESHPEADDSNNSQKKSDTDLRTRIESLISGRASTYEATAHITIDTDGLSVDDLAHSIQRKTSDYTSSSRS